MAMLLLMVAQERFNFHHFEKRSVSTETQKRTKKLLIILRRQRKMYSLALFAQSEQRRFNPQLECSRQLIMRQKIANLLQTLKN